MAQQNQLEAQKRQYELQQKLPRATKVQAYLHDGVAHVLIRNDGERDLAIISAMVITGIKGGNIPGDEGAVSTVPSFDVDMSQFPVNQNGLLPKQPVIEPGKLLQLRVRMPPTSFFPVKLELYYSASECVSATFSRDLLHAAPRNVPTPFGPATTQTENDPFH